MFANKFILALVLVVILPLAVLSAAFGQTIPLEEEGFSITPERIDFGVIRDMESVTRSLEIAGSSNVEWKIKWLPPWLTMDIQSGAADDSLQRIYVKADPHSLSYGSHTSEIIVASSTYSRKIPVYITMLQGDESVPHKVLEKIILSPPTVSAQVGTKILLRAEGLYSDGSRKDITKEIQWISDNKRVGYFVDKGLLAGKSTGNIQIFAKDGRIASASMNIHINPAGGPLLKVRMPKVKLDHMEKGATETFTINLRNAGKGELEWEAISETPWLLIGADSNYEGAGHRRLESAALSRLTGSGEKDIRIKVDVTGLSEGRYDGSIAVHSNGGDEEIGIPVNIISLESIRITPISTRMNVNERILFGATGIWSDGSRVDLSTGSEGRWVLSDRDRGYFLRRRPVFVASSSGQIEIKMVRGDISSNVAVIDIEDNQGGPVLMISPRELDLGTIGPGEGAKGILSLKNVGTAELLWSLYDMEGWNTGAENETENKTFLSGMAGRSGSRLYVSVESVAGDQSAQTGLFTVRVDIQTGNDSMHYDKLMSAGTYQEELKVYFNGEKRSAFLNFTIAEKNLRSCLDIEPLGIDFGIVDPDERLLKRIQLKNLGEKVLRWGAVLQGKMKTFRGMILEKGRYVSFSDDKKPSEDNRYNIPEHLGSTIRTSGEWTSNKGYPCGTGEDAILRYTFSGSGIALLLWKDVYGGSADVFVDDKIVGQIDCASEEGRKRIEFLAAENLDEDTPHTLTVAVRNGTVELEGARLYTSELMEGKRGWIAISPERGTTTNEVDFITVSVSPEKLSAGSYSENIIFYSEEGVEVVEVSLDVTGDNISEFIDIYRKIKGADIWLSPGDKENMEERGDSPLFKLFRRGTPGTTELFQWHSTSKASHFYSIDPSGGKRSLKGYVLDGSIGSIATLKLAGTRELYRWFNPETEAYFYTTDTKGEDCPKKGFLYDGIVGYVK